MPGPARQKGRLCDLHAVWNEGSSKFFLQFDFLLGGTEFRCGLCLSRGPPAQIGNSSNELGPEQKKKKKKKKKKKPTPPAPSPRGTLMGISMPRTMNLTRLLPIVVTGCPTAGQGAHGQWQPPSLRRRSTWSEYPPDPLTGTTTDLKKTPQIPRLRILRILGPVLPHRVYGNVKM